MKKIVKGSLALMTVMSLGTMTANAKTMSSADIANLTKTRVGTLDIYKTAYIFGKNVFMDTINMADVVAASGTLDGNTNPVLYYKDGENVWTNAITNEAIKNPENLSFEMVKLVGEKSGSHISSSDVYDEDYIKTESYGDRVAESFIDTQATLTITSVTPVGPKDLGTDFKTDSHAYNASVVSTNYNSKTLNIISNKPLLAYDGHQWVGLTIKTNHEIAAGDIDSAITFDNVIGSVDNYTGSKSEFTVWIAADEIQDNSQIVVTDGLTPSQNITLSKTLPEVSFVYGDVLANSKLEVLTENANVVKTQRDNSHIAIFYSDDKDVTEIVFKEDGDKKVITEDKTNDVTGSKVTEMIEVATPVKTTITSSDEIAKFNQNAIESITMRAGTKTDDADYVVTITNNAEYKDVSESTKGTISLDMNLSVKYSALTSANSSNESVYSDGTKFKLTLEAGTDANYTYYVTDNDSDQVKIKFVFVNNTKELTLSDVKLANAVDIYVPAAGEGLTDENKINANGVFRNNMSILEFNKTSNMTYAKDTGYTINIQALDSNIRSIIKTVDDAQVEVETFALVMDFGVNSKKITSDDVEIERDDISRYGATSSTAFVVMLDANNLNPITFTNTDTNKSVVVDINVAKVHLLTINEPESISLVNQEGVKIVTRTDENGKSVRKFRVNDNVTTWRAKSGDKEYTYTINAAKNNYTREESIVLSSATKFTDVNNITIPDSIDSEAMKYNQTAVKSVSVDKTTNTINVELDATLKETATGKKEYGILVDFGKAYNSDLTTQTTIAYENETTNNDNKKFVLVLDGAINSDTGKVDDTVVTITDTSDEDVTNKFTVKTTYVKNTAKEYLSLNGTKNISLTNSNQDEYKVNNKGLTAVIETDKATEEKYVAITADKQVAYFNTEDSGDRKRIGVIVDFGTKNVDLAAYVADENNNNSVTIEKDAKVLQRYGATGTQYILWIDATAFVDGDHDPEQYKALYFVFNNISETNKEETLAVKFTFKAVSDDLKIASVKAGNVVENNIVSTSSNYVSTQKSYTTKYMPTQGKVVITPEKRVVTTDEYTIKDVTTTPGNWYAVILDLGINAEDVDVTIPDAGIGFVLDNSNAHAKALGATTNTSVVLWVNASTVVTEDENPQSVELEFTNNYNGETVKLDVVEGRN